MPLVTTIDWQEWCERYGFNPDPDDLAELLETGSLTVRILPAGRFVVVLSVQKEEA